MRPVKKHCDNCNSTNIDIVDNSILHGKSIGPWPYIYYCYDCKASVRCHNNSPLPMGKMADGKTRRLRKKAHFVFDKIWKQRILNRREAYAWLARELKIPNFECHFASLTTIQLIDAIRISEQFYETETALARRKTKQNLRLKKREERNGKKISRKPKRY